VEVKSVLRIGSAHNNVRTWGPLMWTLPKFRMFRIFLNINTISYSFRIIANQNSVRYSDSISYFKKYSSSKCKQTVWLHYGLDFHFKLHSLAWRHIEFRGRAGKGLGTRCSTVSEIAFTVSVSVSTVLSKETRTIIQNERQYVI
jgi:hypothetical protein